MRTLSWRCPLRIPSRRAMALPKRSRLRPPPLSNTPALSSWTWNLWKSKDLLQSRQCFSDGLEVRQFFRAGRLLAVLHHAALIDNKRGAGAHGAQTKQVGQECAVGFSGF